MEYNPYEVAQKILDEIQKRSKELTRLNVMILGKTGVGKSTLINHMFNEQLAETGVGRPITDRIRKIEKPGFPLAIYDTPGLELGGENAVDSLFDEVMGELRAGIRTGDISQAIHCIWYCISTPSHRFEQAEIDFLKRFMDESGDCHVPVIVVLTQSYSKKDAQRLRSEVERENLPIVNVVPVLAEDYDIDEDYVAKAYGLDRLADLMLNVLPETLQNTFVAVQKANLELKKKRAKAIVTASMATAATTGAVPIPFADATLLIPQQVAMLGGITAAFGIPMEQASLLAIISSTVGTAGTTVLGKTIVANLFKLIPGANVVGGVVTATTAAALTAALGEAYIAILVKICQGEMTVQDLTTSDGRQEIARIFRDYLRRRRNGKGEPLE